MRAQVVTKVSKLQLLRRTNPERASLLECEQPRIFTELTAAELAQRRANEVVGDELTRRNIPFVMCSRDDFTGVGADVELVVVVGGDGTVLEVSHQVGSTLMLAVNSDPARSIGYFSACAAPQFGEALARLESGMLLETKLARMALELDGKRLPFPCLNDVLISHQNPAMMSRYSVTLGAKTERHSNSGVWVSTAAGSTAAIRSAGGIRMPLHSRDVQWLCREPFIARGRRGELLRGVAPMDAGLRFTSNMEEGAIYVDGPHLRLDFAIGSELLVESGPDLRIAGLAARV